MSFSLLHRDVSKQIQQVAQRGIEPWVADYARALLDTEHKRWKTAMQERAAGKIDVATKMREHTRAHNAVSQLSNMLNWWCLYARAPIGPSHTKTPYVR